jgi:hypothetical protein
MVFILQPPRTPFCLTGFSQLFPLLISTITRDFLLFKLKFSGFLGFELELEIGLSSRNGALSLRFAFSVECPRSLVDLTLFSARTFNGLFLSSQFANSFSLKVTLLLDL